MFWEKYRRITMIFVIAWTISFGLAYCVFNFIFSEHVGKKPLEQPNNLYVSETLSTIGLDTKIKEQIYFKKCHHLVTRNEVQDQFPKNLSVQKLKEQGWTVFKEGEKKITIFKETDLLCPNCSKKRHLGAIGEYVVVFEGPVGVPGKQLDTLNIKVSSLPDEWQEKVRKGELGFSSERELLEALDSIDEYE